MAAAEGRDKLHPSPPVEYAYFHGRGEGGSGTGVLLFSGMGVLLFRKAFRDGVSRDLPLARLFDRERGFRRSTAPRGEPNSLEPGLYQCTAPAVGCLLGKLFGIFY